MHIYPSCNICINACWCYVNDVISYCCCYYDNVIVVGVLNKIILNFFNDILFLLLLRYNSSVGARLSPPHPCSRSRAAVATPGRCGAQPSWPPARWWQRGARDRSRCNPGPAAPPPGPPMCQQTSRCQRAPPLGNMCYRNHLDSMKNNRYEEWGLDACSYVVMCYPTSFLHAWKTDIKIQSFYKKTTRKSNQTDFYMWLKILFIISKTQKRYSQKDHLQLIFVTLC